MARPIEDGAKYFPHDNDMRNDPRVRALRKHHPHTGYELYNMTLEMLTDSRGFVMGTTSMDIDLIAADFDVEPAELRSIWDTCVSLGLLQRNEDGTLIWSARHQERLSVVVENRERDRERKRRQRCPAGQPGFPPDFRCTPAGQSSCHADVRGFPVNESRGEESILDSPLLSYSSAAPNGGAPDGAASGRQLANATPREELTPTAKRLEILDKQAKAGNQFAAKAAAKLRTEQQPDDWDEGPEVTT